MNSQDSKKQLEELIKEAKDGNKESFRMIFDKLSNDFFIYIFSRTSSRDDALDIVQETFIDLWKALGRLEYRSDEAFYGFIFKIVKRKLFRYYRTKPKFVPVDEDAKELSYETETEDFRYLLGQVNALTTRYQDVLKLRYWSAMSFKEIALTLSITESAAKVRHHRALEKLKNNFNIRPPAQ